MKEHDGLLSAFDAFDQERNVIISTCNGLGLSASALSPALPLALVSPGSRARWSLLVLEPFSALFAQACAVVGTRPLNLLARRLLTLCLRRTAPDFYGTASTQNRLTLTFPVTFPDPRIRGMQMRRSQTSRGDPCNRRCWRIKPERNNPRRPLVAVSSQRSEWVAVLRHACS